MGQILEPKYRFVSLLISIGLEVKFQNCFGFGALIDPRGSGTKEPKEIIFQLHYMYNTTAKVKKLMIFLQLMTWVRL